MIVDRKRVMILLITLLGLHFLLNFVAIAIGGTVTVQWDPNSESDLAGYKIYVGESSRNYSGVVDAGTATQFAWQNLESGKTYFFVVTAYDFAGNESDYSAEVSATLETGGGSGGNNDMTPPNLTSIVVKSQTEIDVRFDEPVEQQSAEKEANYSINRNIDVRSAVLDGNLTTVHLTTSAHESGQEYTLTVSHINDRASTPNELNSASKTYKFSSGNGDLNDNPDGSAPQTFTLFQNYPNPFNPETEIRFLLDKERNVELKVYNTVGQLVKTLTKSKMSGGYHTLIWDGTNEKGRNVPSGVYIYSLEFQHEVRNGDLLVDVSRERRVKRMTLVR